MEALCFPARRSAHAPPLRSSSVSRAMHLRVSLAPHLLKSLVLRLVLHPLKSLVLTLVQRLQHLRLHRANTAMIAEHAKAEAISAVDATTAVVEAETVVAKAGVMAVAKVVPARSSQTNRQPRLCSHGPLRASLPSQSA